MLVQPCLFIFNVRRPSQRKYILKRAALANAIMSMRALRPWLVSACRRVCTALLAVSILSLCWQCNMCKHPCVDVSGTHAVACLCRMHMMDSDGMRSGGRRGAGPGSAFRGMPHGMFFTTSMHGNPTVFGYGGSRYVFISHTSVTGSVPL